MSNQITIGPLANPHWADLASRRLFSPSQCGDIIALLRDDRWGQATLADYERQEGLVDATVRSAGIQVLPLDGSWAHDSMLAALSEINSSTHKFRLTGLDAGDRPAVLRYEAGTNDHFRPHIDVGSTNSTRKLSFVVQLTDPNTYQGGDLVFSDLGRSAPREQGTLIVFPSFLKHVVSPVVSGTRHALVSWLHGPTFR